MAAPELLRTRHPAMVERMVGALYEGEVLRVRRNPDARRYRISFYPRSVADWTLLAPNQPTTTVLWWSDRNPRT